jgi:hypothetical protein
MGSQELYIRVRAIADELLTDEFELSHIVVAYDAVGGGWVDLEPLTAMTTLQRYRPDVLNVYARRRPVQKVGYLKRTYEVLKHNPVQSNTPSVPMS